MGLVNAEEGHLLWQVGEPIYQAVMDAINVARPECYKLSHQDVAIAVIRALISIVRTVEKDHPDHIQDIRDIAIDWVRDMLADESIVEVVLQ